MHARHSDLARPGEKDAPLSGLAEQLDFYSATNTSLLRTDRLPPASFGPVPRLEIPQRPPRFQPGSSTDYSADLKFAELLMSDDSLGSASLDQLTLSSIVPTRAHQPGAKFANAPSRAHNRTSTSNNSSPATTSTRLSVDHIPTADHQSGCHSDQATQITTEPETKRDPPSSPHLAESTTSSSVSTVATTTTTTKQRSARATRRSPAPRRQECSTCGKKFQRPCQLVTHIRSHTGEQPHACPVCSRRFSVLSNCQRHVKLCQKRSPKVLNPGEEESTNESAANATPFIQFSNGACNTQPAPTVEPATRRSHEIPIRPKLASRESGSTNSSVGGSDNGARAQRSKHRSGSSSSTGSLAPKSELSSMPPSLERRGSGSAMPVVPSSPAYPQGSYPASYGYPQSTTYGNYGQGTYESSGPTYNNTYGGNYGSVSSGYDQAAPGFEQASAAAYDSLNPGFNAPGPGYEHSAPGYGTSSPAFDNAESGFNQPHQYPAPAAGPPHIQTLPSPSHVQPTPHSTASPNSVSHDGASYFTRVPAAYAAPSARRPSVTSSAPSHRSTIAHTLVQRDQLGFRDAEPTDTPSMVPTSDAGAGPPITASGAYYSPSSGLVAAPYESRQLKQEETMPDLAHQIWTKEPQSYEAGYSEPQWASAAGTDAPHYHAYHSGSTSSVELTGRHDTHVTGAPTGYAAYPQQQPQQPQQSQPRQQLYLQQAQGGYSNPPEQQQQQQAQQHNAYGSNGYADHSTVYGMNSRVVSVPGHSHQNSPNYAWPGSEPAWNEQSVYHS
ncbi:hypothetical protein OPQ81_009237 [Rhizoctonia solani]|nr:hypothetical protein OPQ81_009237 [Rhizoctonia solani]